MMSEIEKLGMVRTLLCIDAADTGEDERIAVYLKMAEQEILSWRYSYSCGNTPECVPSEYEMTQIQAVVNGYSMIGAEGQSMHDEDGIRRTFSYPCMLSYIRAHVIPIARCL